MTSAIQNATLSKLHYIKTHEKLSRDKRSMMESFTITIQFTDKNLQCSWWVGGASAVHETFHASEHVRVNFYAKFTNGCDVTRLNFHGNT
jgi:hypothetical protein